MRNQTKIHFLRFVVASLFCGMVLAGCEWRWSEVPYQKPSGYLPASVETGSTPQLPVVAVAIFSDGPLEWRALAVRAPMLRLMALVRVPTGIAAIAPAVGDRAIQEIWLGEEQLQGASEILAGGWNGVILDEDSADKVLARGMAAQFADQTAKASYVVTPDGTGWQGRKLQDTSGSSGCFQGCRAGDLFFDNAGHFLGSAGREGIIIQEPPTELLSHLGVLPDRSGAKDSSGSVGGEMAGTEQSGAATKPTTRF